MDMHLLDPMQKIKDLFAQQQQNPEIEPPPINDPNETAINPMMSMQGQQQQGGQDPMSPLHHEAADKLTALLNSVPERNHPGMGRRIGAIIAGALGGGPNMTESIMYAPYHRQMEEYRNKFGPTYRAAEVEKSGNALASNNYYKDLLNDYRVGEAGRRERQGDERLGMAEKKLTDAEEQTKVKNARDERALKIKEDAAKGGTIVKEKKSGKTWMVYKDGTKKDVDINDLDAQTLIDMQNEGRFKVMDKREEHDKDMVKFRNERIIERKQKEKELGLGMGSGKEESESQKKVEIGNRARKFVNDYPELAKYVHVDGDAVNIDKEGTGNFFGFSDGLDATERKDIMDYIYEGVAVPKSGPGAKGSAFTKAPGSTGTPTPDVSPKPSAFSKSSSESMPLKGKTPPPLEKRTKGMRFEWDNGNVGEWDGTKWVPITIKVK